MRPAAHPIVRCWDEAPHEGMPRMPPHHEHVITLHIYLHCTPPRLRDYKKDKLIQYNVVKDSTTLLRYQIMGDTGWQIWQSEEIGLSQDMEGGPAQCSI